MIRIDEIIKTIESGLLTSALNSISREASFIGARDIADRVQQLENGFNYMLDYYATGAQDPTRQEMLAHVFDETYTLANLLKTRIKKDSKKQNIPLAEVDVSNLPQLFEAVEYNFPSTRDDRNIIEKLILDEDNPLYFRALVLTALTFNLLNYFENEKFESLYQYTLDDQPQIIRMRAWVAIVLVTMRHNYRISTQPRLVEQIRLLTEEGTDIKGFNVLMNIQMTLFLCLEAQRAKKMMFEELSPTIEKGLKEIENKKKKNPIPGEEDINPEWEEYMEKSGLQDKLQEFMEMQKNGIDVMFDSFKMMSSNISFFHEKCNWFVPFTLDHPEVQKILKKLPACEKFIKMLDLTGGMCDTDKFGNMLMLNLMAKDQIGKIEETLIASNTNLENIAGASDEDIIRNYLHDLYRYFNISRFAKKEEDNPFIHRLFFNKYSRLSAIVNDTETLRMIGAFLIKYQNYLEAERVYFLLKDKETTEDSLQKYAYCLIMLYPDKGYEKDVLAQCNNLFSGNLWTIKHYAGALMKKEDFHSAEIVIREALQTFNEDLYLIVALSECLVKQKRYEEAMEQLYKADVLHENSAKVKRHMAWCAFLLGNKAKAASCINEVLESKVAKEIDWKNGGHIALLCGDINLAIERYKKADSADMTITFFDDHDALIEAGITEEDITLAHELLIREQKEL